MKFPPHVTDVLQPLGQKRKKVNRAAEKKIKYSKEDQEDKDIEDDVDIRNNADVDALPFSDNDKDDEFEDPVENNKIVFQLSGKV